MYFVENGLRDEKYIDRAVVTDCFFIKWGLKGGLLSAASSAAQLVLEVWTGQCALLLG